MNVGNTMCAHAGACKHACAHTHTRSSWLIGWYAGKKETLAQTITHTEPSHWHMHTEPATPSTSQENAAGVAALSRFLRTTAERVAGSSPPGTGRDAGNDREAVIGVGPMYPSTSLVHLDSTQSQPPEPLLPSQSTWEEEQPESEPPAAAAESVHIGVQQRMRRESLLQDHYKF